MSVKEILSGFKERYKANLQAKQAFRLLIWNFIALPLSFVTNIVVTRYMGAEQYGNYLYIQRVLEFAIIVLNFGLFRSINRAVLLADTEEKRREYYGIGLLYLGAIYLLIVISLVLAAFIMPNFSEKGIKEIFLCIVPFCFIYYFKHLYEQILPANNRIDLLIIARYYPRIAFFVCSGVIYWLFKGNDTLNPVIVVWSFFLTTQLFIYLYVLFRLRPKFTHLKERLREAFRYNKEYGIHVYFGDLFSTAFTALMPLLISRFSADNVDVGFYSLSLMLSSPLSYIPIVIATSHYAKFATYNTIPKKLFLVTGAFSLFGLICLWVIVGPFVNLFYTPDFKPVIFLTFITSIGTLLYSLSDFISRYLASQGDGKALRNSSWIVGFTTLSLSLLLIPKYKATGASITHVVAGIVYIGTIFFYYFKRVKFNKTDAGKII
ncbi:MAG TPA: oligosaccharide flippase family protein [Bacteroidales bacterium]|jgi:O-antigen/teichoic acid export membrane protein|nr:oligosaccharide flippase family protein [Bacteroidales bacterium]